MQADEPTRYADLLNTYLSAITTLSARFEQTTTDQTAYDTAYDKTIYDGRLWMEKPNRFRVDTINPSLQTVVSDGIDFWSYDEDLEQVVISRLNEDLNQVPILLFSSDILSIQRAPRSIFTALERRRIARQRASFHSHRPPRTDNRPASVFSRQAQTLG